MTMPAKIKTWTHNANNRVTYTAFLDVHQQQWQGWKENLKLGAGVTVKGSSDNVTAALDGTDRINTAVKWVRGSSTTVTHSWVLLHYANIGTGIDVLFDYAGSTDESMRICVSPTSAYAINGTNSRYSPTAADEVIVYGSTTVGATLGSTATSGDRIWTAANASDGKAFILLAARAGAWVSHVILEEVVSAVVAPATFSPAWIATAGTTAPAISGWHNGTVWKTKANGVNLGGTAGCSTSMEATSSGTIPSVYSSVLELQNSQWPVMALGLWSTVAGARGKLCNLIDIHAGNVSAADGDTYPNDATRTHVAFGDFVLVWDGSAPVMS